MDRPPLRIVLASDMRSWLQDVHTHLAQFPWLQVVGEVSVGVDTLVACYQERPDVLLLDLSHPPIPVPTLLATIHHFVPTTRIIGCTPLYHKEIAALVTQSRIASYLTDHDLYQSLVQVLTMVINDRFWMSTPT